MKPALAIRQPDFPLSWADLPNGDIIADHINQVLSSWWPKFFGYYLLKIGALSAELKSKPSPIKYHLNLTEQQPLADIITDVDDLAIATHSVDVCVLSHVFEFSIDPHHVIREANRVLIANGYMVITGYNPFSLAGLNKFVPYRRHNTPWNERLFSPMRIKDWLQLMGYEVQLDYRFLHTTLSGEISHSTLAQAWQKLAENLLANFGSVYVLVAKKRERPLTPIKAKWQLRPQFQPVKLPTMNASSK